MILPGIENGNSHIQYFNIMEKTNVIIKELFAAMIIWRNQNTASLLSWSLHLMILMVA